MATLATEIPLLPGPLTLLPDDAFPAPVFRAEVAAAAAELTAEAVGETELLAGALRALTFEAAIEQKQLAANRPELTDATLGVAAAAADTEDPALAEMVATLDAGEQVLSEVEALVPEVEPEPITPPATGGAAGDIPAGPVPSGGRLAEPPSELETERLV